MFLAHVILRESKTKDVPMNAWPDKLKYNSLHESS